MLLSGLECIFFKTAAISGREYLSSLLQYEDNSKGHNVVESTVLVCVQ